ncbi:MAG: sialidase family protein [Polyangiales bacterium]
MAATAATVQADSAEKFQTVASNATGSELTTWYVNGGGGMFLSRDAGKHYSLMCSSAIGPDLRGSNGALMLLNAGALYLGTSGGAYRGGVDGCGFSEIPELMGHFLSAFAADPIDPMRTYVVTSDGADKANGVRVHDGSPDAQFVPLGTQEPLFFNTLHVVARADGRRFYATGSKYDAMANRADYSIKVSDDEGQTWTHDELVLDQFGPQSPVAELAILAVDPQQPDRLVAGIRREEASTDSVIYSAERGRPGTWRLLAEVNELQAAAFMPDGRLYFGDNDQSSPRLFVLDDPDAEPRVLSTQWKVRCLYHDAQQAQLMACSDYRLGAVALDTGDFEPHFDMRCADSFVECPGETPVRDRCEPQLLLGYCGAGHYPPAPLCRNYELGSLAEQLVAEAGYRCENGVVVITQGTAGQPATAGASAAVSVSGAGGDGGGGTAAPTGAGSDAAVGGNQGVAGSASDGGAPDAPKSGCQCHIAAANSGDAPLLGSLLTLALVWYRLQQRRAQPRGARRPAGGGM